jgi:O-antigen ligase
MTTTVSYVQPRSAQRLGGKLLLWAFGFAPVVQILLTLGVRTSPETLQIKTDAWSLVAVEIAVIVIAFVEGARVRLPRLVVALLLAFAVLAWWTAATAASPSFGLRHTALWTVHLLFGWAMSQLRFIDAEEAAHGFLAGFAAFAILLAAYVGQLNPLASSLDSYDWRYDLPGFGNLRRFGFYAAPAAAMCFGLLALTPRRWWLWGGVSATAFAMMFWSGSRGAVWALIAGLSVTSAIFPTARSLRAAGVTIGAALTGLAIAAAVPAISSQPIGRFGRLDGNGREEIWAAAMQAISARPWFGYGEAQAFLALDWPPWMSIMPHPHNVVLQVLLAWGLVGAALLALPGFMLGRVVVRHGQSDPRLLPVLASAIVLAAFSMIDGTLYGIHPTSVFAIGIGLAAGRRA